MSKVDLGPEMAAEKLRFRRNKIIEDFVQVSLSEIECAAKVSRDELVDCLPELLNYLGYCLLEGPDAIEKIAAVGVDHGRVRGKNRHFEMKDVIKEYKILSRLILRHLRQNADLTEATVDKIMEALLAGLGNAMSSFMETKEFTLQNYQEDSGRRLARALELTQKEQESFFRNAHCPMFMTVGKLHRVTLANEAFEKLMGRNVVGERLALGPLLEGLEDVAHSGKPYYLEHGSFPQGRIFNIYLHPHFEVNGAFKGIMGLLEDVNSSLARPNKIFIEVRHQH